VRDHPLDLSGKIFAGSQEIRYIYDAIGTKLAIDSRNLTMKKLLLILLAGGICTGCPFLPVMDPARGSVDIRNYSDRPIYFYESWDDSLALNPSLDLFVNISYPDTTKTFRIMWRSADTIYAPSYRIDAYNVGSIVVSGSPERPKFPNKTDTLSLFFITEETMRNYSWEEIWRQQMYVKKVSFSEADMQKRHWAYTYYPQ
jgi:hypothetical protein